MKGDKMKYKVTNGIISTPISFMPTDITIRAEKTDKLTTVSLADDKLGIMIQVNYKDIKELVKRLK